MRTKLFPLHARDGIKIVDRVCHPCQSSDLRFGHPTRMCMRARIRATIRARRWPISSVAALVDRQKRVAISQGWRCGNVGIGTTARLYRRQIV